MQRGWVRCVIRATVAALLAVATAAPAHGQDAPALEQKLARSTGTERIATLADLTDALKNDRPTQAIAYGEEALRLLASSASRDHEVRVLCELGWAYMVAARNTEALAAVERARTLAAERGDRQGLARALNNLGVIAQRRGDPSHAVQQFEQALDIYRSLGDEANVAGALNDLGFLYTTELADYETALTYHVEALKIHERLNDKPGLALSLNNVGIVHGRLGDHRLALDYFGRALEISRALPGQQNRVAAILNNIGDEYVELGELEEALAYHEHALELRREVGDRSGTAISLKNLGAIYTAQGQIDLAIRTLLDALRTAEETQDRSTVALTLIALSAARRAQHDGAQAVADAQRATALAQQLASPEIERHAWEALSAAEESAGNPAAALDAYKKFKRADDRLFNDEKAKRVEALERRYQAEKHETEIAHLRSRDAQAQIEASQRTLQLNLVLAIAVVLAIIGFGLYRRRVESARIAAELSVTDSLTGAKNRRYVQQTIPGDIAACDRRRRDSAGRAADADMVFMLIDIDTFKSVNDNFGHAAGDAVLIQIVKLLKEACRASDSVVRWGGEEFLVVHRFADRRNAPAIAERIREAIASYEFRLPDQRTIRRTCSIGFATHPFSRVNPSALDWEQVVGIADHALYFAKRGGANAWIGVTASESAAPARLQYHGVDDLMHAIASGAMVAQTSNGIALVGRAADDEAVRGSA